ncbi:hypothetical protein AUK22_06810 [bacterium CG2_30_54_10]|nr:MAG: hypothetical protein AUK22_06810 [bacterium CG2_30_54_10]
MAQLAHFQALYSPLTTVTQLLYSKRTFQSVQLVRTHPDSKNDNSAKVALLVIVVRNHFFVLDKEKLMS